MAFDVSGMGRFIDYMGKKVRPVLQRVGMTNTVRPAPQTRQSLNQAARGTNRGAAIAAVEKLRNKK